VSSSVPLSNTIWLALSESDSPPEEFFAGITVPFDCEFLVGQKKDGCVILTEVYNIGPALPLQTNCFGNWSSRIGISTPSRHFYQRRNSLQNSVLRAGVLQA
jgi:hypothetical protein